MKHYFTDNTDLKSEQSQFIFRFHKYDLLFTSDNGVFSKSMIDYGSRVLLDNIEITNEKTLRDVGCGYGTFGICLNKVYSHLNVDMVDVNDRALELAKLNAKNNNIHANIYKSFIYENVQGSYDVIVTNPPVRAGKEVVTTILQESIEHLNENGSLWVILQKKQGAPSAKKKMEEVFGNCEIVKRDKGYYLLHSVKR
ncbi:MAG: class I SAM-dependent methyltransferase [Faecalibacillus sp.]